ncbi:nephrocystin-4-like isoform X2 [Osmerus eperlanus]|uniref:nephrocystin-4-like isoform X2 n=1 Tax=Osmerus eperlanus TaxID=29151 RepID=UPI002E131111
MDRWKGLYYQRCREIPSHSQTIRLAQGSHITHSQGFQITMKSLDGPHIHQESSEGEQAVTYQLRLSLLDKSHQHFFGRTWKSSPQMMKANCKIKFNEVVYFHTSLRVPSVLAVVELVALSPRAEGSQHALGCGFGILDLFGSHAEPQATEGDRRLDWYYGTPRTLLQPESMDPKKQLLRIIEGAHLVFNIKPHPALAPIMHLFPENILVSGDENIPGLVPSPTGDSLLKPHTLKMVSCALDRLTISLYPSLDKFETQLLHLINADCNNMKHWGPEGTLKAVVIQERRLHVGVHNGWAFLEPPQVVVLELQTQAQGSRVHKGSPSRQNSLTREGTSSAAQTLALRSSLELKLANHRDFGIVLQLEYVFSTPVGGDGKVSLTSTSRAAFMQCLRWGVWCPFDESGAWKGDDVHLALQGGATPNPWAVMVYTESAKPQSPVQGRGERDVARFRLVSGLEKKIPSPSVSPHTKRENTFKQKKPPPSPVPGFRLALQASPPSPPQGPGLSLSQLAATSRYPTMSHFSAASPWQQPLSSVLYPSPLATAHQLSHVAVPAVTNIGHLEADLTRGSSPGGHEDWDPLQELPFTPVHAPVVAMGTHVPSSSSRSSRSSMAHIFSAGFPDIVDRSGQVAEVLDPTEPVNFDPQREEADSLQGNLLVLQFLAFSRMKESGVSPDWPSSIYITFQIYRFPPTTTHRLSLQTPDQAQHNPRDTLPCVLAAVKQDGTVNTDPPGLQLQFPVDQALLQPGERSWFLRYLALHTLQLDVWDADSLLLIGSAGIELKHMLRQGRAAVQATYELEVINTEYISEEAVVTGGDLTRRKGVTPINVLTVVKGKLHMRMGNVGCPVKHTSGRPLALPLPHSRIISSHSSGFRGGSLSSTNTHGLNGTTVQNTARAQRMVEVDGDLLALLQSRIKDATLVSGGHTWGEMDDVRQRKLERMAAVRQRERQAEEGNDVKTKVMGRREERAQLARDLRLIEAYRERCKVEGITNMLSRAITTQHTMYATLGTAEFFEFVLKNPYNVQQTVTIESDDRELSVITDSAEWRHFKDLTKTLTPLEENMFQLKGGNTLTPQVYLRPKESVYIPLKYQTFYSQHSAVPQGPSFLPTGRQAQVAKKHQSNTILAKTVKVTFRSEDGKPLAICQVKVEPTPSMVDQSIRFYHPEGCFLKKSLRLSPWEDPAAGDSDAGTTISVRCSDPNVICETRLLAKGEPQDLYLKVPGCPSPQVKKFFLIIYTDKWLATPFQIWLVYIHFLQRVDLSCYSGQQTCQSLVLRGTQAIRKVKCYVSHQLEVEMDPAGVFVLPPGAVQEVQLRVQPRKPGSKFVFLSVVDVEHHTLLTGWLLCLNIQKPLLSKAFEVSVPVGKGRGSTRKLTYTNPYTSSRVFLLHSDHPDLLQFKEDHFEVGGGQSYVIGLRFASSQSPGCQEIYVYVNNQEEKTEETFCVMFQESKVKSSHDAKRKYPEEMQAAGSVGSL